MRKTNIPLPFRFILGKFKYPFVQFENLTLVQYAVHAKSVFYNGKKFGGTRLSKDSIPLRRLSRRAAFAAKQGYNFYVCCCILVVSNYQLN
jgi:hypothetical protein